MIEDFRRVDRKPGEAFCAMWLLTVPWAHPLWSQYFVSLVDLTTAGKKPAILVRPGMTHEVMVWAIDPGQKQTKLGQSWPPILNPANHGYQFKAETDDRALQRISSYVDSIERRLLSPDTDFTSTWDHLFADGVTLKVNMLERALATVQ